MNKREIAMVKTIDGEAKVTIETAQSREELELKDGSCLVVVAPANEEEPQPEPEPTPDPEPEDERLTFIELLNAFNEMLDIPVNHEMMVNDAMYWAFICAKREWENPESEYFGKDAEGCDPKQLTNGYNAMQAWLMASQLVEYVPDEGILTNRQTLLFYKAYEIGGGSKMPHFGYSCDRCNPMACREAAAFILADCHQEWDADKIASFREELGGQAIPASSWDGLGYENHVVTDDEGRKGYAMDRLGYLINTQTFLPNAPGPRVSGTIVCELPMPYEEGQETEYFNLETGNYNADEFYYNWMVRDWNMMAQTPLSEWMNYSVDKQNRLVNAAATVCCTYNYMFGAAKQIQLILEDGELPIVDGYPRYVFEECADGNLTIDGPFSDLAGIYRFNVADDQKTLAEGTIEKILEVADNGRFPTQDPNYGRCRPGCTCTRQGGERNPVHGSPENELYNVSISCMVADTEEQRQKWAEEDGWAADSPRSYVSGHSAQITAMALILSTMNPSKLHEYRRRSFLYSENRAIARYHWMSDVVYGRLFGTMIVPILRAMDGMQAGYKAMKDFIDHPQPSGESVISINVAIQNRTGMDVTLDGDLRFVLQNPTKAGEYIGWTGCYNRTPHIRFADGPVVIPSGEVRKFEGLTYSEDVEIMDASGNVLRTETIGLGGRNPLPAELLPESGRKSNVLLYVSGDSEVVVCEPMDSDTIFEEGGTYYLVFI